TSVSSSLLGATMNQPSSVREDPQSVSGVLTADIQDATLTMSDCELDWTVSGSLINDAVPPLHGEIGEEMQVERPVLKRSADRRVDIAHPCFLFVELHTFFSGRATFSAHHRNSSAGVRDEVEGRLPPLPRPLSRWQAASMLHPS
ncbi:hypothetical protein, partial [Methylorubrum populi]|uniref:hypothetical protein n=1 Tax=Methylorubrum populi TaxID=223967 RepID=UPI00235686B3